MIRRNYDIENDGYREDTLEEKAYSPIRTGIIGFGVVGEAVAQGLKTLGHNVYVHDISDERLEKAASQGYKTSNGNFYDLREADVTFLMLPTPTTHLPYPSYAAESNADILKSVASEIAENQLRNHSSYHLFVNRSTVIPGTTRRVGNMMQELSGKELGREFSIAMNPEFLRAYRAYRDFIHPKLTVLGILEDRSGNLLEKVYRGINAPVRKLTLEQAEWAKYINNTFNAVKISYHNEIHNLMESSGLSPQECEDVIGASTLTAEGYWNPEYGTHGGRPFDGTCLPKDLHALINFARQLDAPANILRAAGEVNEKIIAKIRVDPEKNSIRQNSSSYFSERDHETYHSDSNLGNHAASKQEEQARIARDNGRIRAE